MTGLSMWPALRAGDRLFGRPYPHGDRFGRPPPGAILVADLGDGPQAAACEPPGKPPDAQGPPPLLAGNLVAHRLVRLAGGQRHTRVFLAGDLSGPDLPLAEGRVRAIVEALHRPGVGFVELSPPLGLGPLGRALVSRAAQLWAMGGRNGHDR